MDLDIRALLFWKEVVINRNRHGAYQDKEVLKAESALINCGYFDSNGKIVGDHRNFVEAMAMLNKSGSDLFFFHFMSDSYFYPIFEYYESQKPSSILEYLLQYAK